MDPRKKKPYLTGTIILLAIYLVFQISRWISQLDDQERMKEVLQIDQPVSTASSERSAEELTEAEIPSSLHKVIEEAARKAAEQHPPPAEPDGERSSTSSLTLVQIGEAKALKGRVVHLPGTVLAVDLNEKAYSPFAPQKPVTAPRDGKIYEVSDCPESKISIPVDLPLPPEETVAAVAQGQVGDIQEATVVLTQGSPPGDHLLDVQLAPMHVRIFEGPQEVASVALGEGFLPCTVILDDLDGDPESEIAVVWASVAAGYTMGVTVFATVESI